MAEVTPVRRNDDLGNGQFVGDVDRVHRPRSPEDKARTSCEVVPTFNRDEPYALHEIVDGHAQDGISGVDNGNAKRRGDPFLDRPSAAARSSSQPYRCRQRSALRRPSRSCASVVVGSTAVSVAD